MKERHKWKKQLVYGTTFPSQMLILRRVAGLEFRIECDKFTVIQPDSGEHPAQRVSNLLEQGSGACMRLEVFHIVRCYFVYGMSKQRTF